MEPTHAACAVWEAAEGLDLSAWLNDIHAVEGQPGRDATDPRLLVALWVYATRGWPGFAPNTRPIAGCAAGAEG